MKNRILIAFLALVLVAVPMLVGACSKSTPEEKAPIKIGLIRAFTGMVTDWGQEMSQGAHFALEEAGWQVAGRQIILVEEDEGETPDVAVTKARKLVTQDKVDVVVGPLLANSGVAVGAYLKSVGVLHFPSGCADAATSDWSIYGGYGSGRGNSEPGGIWSAQTMGWKTAAVMYMDYLMGYQTRDGFVKGFTDNGGKIVYNTGIPFGTVDMAPYLTAAAAAKPDVLVVFLLSPALETFVTQYSQYGLKMPVFHMGTVPREATIQQLGDNIIGMYGSDPYTAEINTAENKAFVSAFKDKYGVYPGDGSEVTYLPIVMYLQAVEALGGDTDPVKVAAKIDEIGTFVTPVGTFIYKQGSRVPYLDMYMLKAVRLDRIAWEVVATYPQVKPW
jgi:branched-chain amino acid transport system substrate-binding protein